MGAKRGTWKGWCKPDCAAPSFTSGAMELCEVELQYQKEEWDEAKYDDFMGQVRRRIEQRYGLGQQIVRRTEPEGTVTQTVVGYQWNLNNTEIELFLLFRQRRSARLSHAKRPLQDDVRQTG